MPFTIPKEKIVYASEPEHSMDHTQTLDRGYSKYAKIYDVAVKWLPVWKTWIKAVIPHIEGSRVLEASFGTGYGLVKIMEAAGDTIRDISSILQAFSFGYTEKEIGGFGGVHFYIAQKRSSRLS